MELTGDNPLISLVIPVFNVERYLPRCIDSVLAQTYDNYEVILVDDGSTDNSGKLCDKYANIDPRIKAYHKENGGLSDARNFGVAVASGDLISFIDSDDCITEDYVTYLYQLKVRYDADLACARRLEVIGDDIPNVSNNDLKPNECILDTINALERLCYTSVAAHPRLYNKDVLLKCPYPKGRIFEDLANTCKIMGECESVAFSDKVIYYYFNREGSLSHSSVDLERDDIFWAANELMGYISNEYPEALPAAKLRCIHDMMMFLDRLFGYGSKDDERVHFKKARDFANPCLASALLNSHSSLNTRLSCLAIWLGYYPSKLLWKVKFSMKRLLNSRPARGGASEAQLIGWYYCDACWIGGSI